MGENLLRPNWTNLDQHDLRLLLDKRIGGPGQFDDRRNNPNKFYLPLARDACKVTLTFKEKKIIAIEAGPAFDPAEWQKIADEIENTILVGPKKIGREYSFCSYRVVGSWRGDRSGVQILPPPPEAPRAPMEMADHPFILEFPITGAPDDLWSITNHRRIREHSQLTRVLNVFLTPTVSFESSRNAEHFWAHIPPNTASVTPEAAPSAFIRIALWMRRKLSGRVSTAHQRQERDNDNGESRWLQRWFWAPLGAVVTDALSPPTAEKIEEIDPGAYYAGAGYDGKPLRVPTDLDDCLCRFRDLAEGRAKFDRAAYWMDIASRQWNVSVSASFGSLVSAIESLTERGAVHTVDCPKCGKPQSHESPGATERFRSFFDTFAPGATLRERRSKMYALRSNILHGGDLMQFDQNRDFGWAPPGWNETELHRELWSITSIALRNWLKNQNGAEK